MAAGWRWEAFIREDEPLADVVARAAVTASAQRLMPQTLVLLDGGEPVGTASLTAQDLDERPDLTPWLAGVVVLPQARRRGHASLLVQAVERLAAEGGIGTLWLYTSTAERIYARLGWTVAERFKRGGKDNALMRRELS